MLMGKAVLGTVGRLTASAVALVGMVATMPALGAPRAVAGAPAVSPTSPINVIPLPAHVEPRSGSFAIRAGTRIANPRDPRAARVARYFAELMLATRGVQLSMAPGVGAKLSTASAPTTGVDSPTGSAPAVGANSPASTRPAVSAPGVI